MLTVDLTTLPLQTNWTAADPTQRCRSAFPLFGGVGTERISMVYFELDPGEQLGRHTDSAEELLLILEGAVEVTVGEERGVLSAGHAAIVPTMAPHNLRNIGAGVVRVAGIFPEPQLVATFDQVWDSMGTRVVDTSQIPASA